MRTKLTVTLCLLCLTLLVGCQKPESPPPAIPPGTKHVCLFFDDGWQNQYDVALPILLEHDFKATFGIITGSIRTSKGLSKFMSEKELKELAEYGMDIASHTKTHPHLTADLTDQQLREETIDSKKDLEEMGFKVRTFIHPYFEWDNRVLSYVKQAGYVCARSGAQGKQPYNLRTGDPDARYYANSVLITNQTLEQFKAIVADADEHSVVCLCYHFISDTEPEITSTQVNNFREQMLYLKEAGFTVSLLPDLIQ